MTGPEHYAEAERLTGVYVDAVEAARTVNAGVVVLAAAQVHATLALVAATLDTTGYRDQFRHEAAWAEVLQ